MGKLVWIIAVFFVLGGYMIFQASDYSVDDEGDRKSFIVEFAKWVWNVGKTSKNVVSYVIKEDWLPETAVNQTNETIE